MISCLDQMESSSLIQEEAETRRKAKVLGDPMEARARSEVSKPGGLHLLSLGNWISSERRESHLPVGGITKMAVRLKALDY